VAIFGVSIEKTVSFRGVNQVFANVYHYDSGGSAPSDANLDALIDNMVTKEKAFHSASVTWVRGRVWSAGGSQASNQMRVDKSLSGAGGLSNHPDMDRERAVLVRWRAGSDSRGRPVYLRKFWHVCAQNVGGVALAAGILGNTAQFTGTVRDNVETAADGLASIVISATTFTLCGPNGRNITGSTECHPYLEHHQLGDMWRGV
jgi:hypothetical protein